MDNKERYQTLYSSLLEKVGENNTLSDLLKSESEFIETTLKDISKLDFRRCCVEINQKTLISLSITLYFGGNIKMVYCRVKGYVSHDMLVFIYFNEKLIYRDSGKWQIISENHNL